MGKRPHRRSSAAWAKLRFSALLATRGGYSMVDSGRDLAPTCYILEKK